MSAFRRVRFVFAANAGELNDLRLGSLRTRLVIGFRNGVVRMKVHPSHKADVIKACGAAFAALHHTQQSELLKAMHGKAVHESVVWRFAVLADKQLVEVFG